MTNRESLRTELSVLWWVLSRSPCQLLIGAKKRNLRLTMRDAMFLKVCKVQRAQKEIWMRLIQNPIFQLLESQSKWRDMTNWDLCWIRTKTWGVLRNTLMPPALLKRGGLSHHQSWTSNLCFKLEDNSDQLKKDIAEVNEKIAAVAHGINRQIKKNPSTGKLQMSSRISSNANLRSPQKKMSSQSNQHGYLKTEQRKTQQMIEKETPKKKLSKKYLSPKNKDEL